MKRDKHNGYLDDFLEKQWDELIERVNKIGACKHTFDDGFVLGNIITFTCTECGWFYKTLYIKDDVEMTEQRKHLYELIQYYYIHNPNGGNLHAVLHDGNLDHILIIPYMSECRDKEDWLGVWIVEELLAYPSCELYEMYYTGCWGMIK